MVHTYVIGEEVRGEAFGPVTERGVIMSVSPEHQQNSTDQHSGVEVSCQAAFPQNKPGERQTHILLAIVMQRVHECLAYGMEQLV